MTQRLSKTKQQDLDVAISLWQRANIHPSALQWRHEAIENFALRDGLQWLDSDIEKLRQRGQKPLTVNITKSTIKALLGAQIQTRFWNAIRSDSTNPKDDELAKYLTHLLYYIQRRESMSYKGSLKYEDMMVCGIGYSEIYRQNGAICYDYVHPLNVIMDPDDLTPQYTNSKFMCRKRWMSPDMVQKIWPHAGMYVDFSEIQLATSTYSPEIMDRSSNYTNTENYQGSGNSRVLVSEVQHKKPKTAYSGIDRQGLYFETFNEEMAEEMADSKKEIQTFESEIVVRTIFIDKTLLENSIVEPSLPGNTDFTHIPCVLGKRMKDGVPQGLVGDMKDLQRDLNVRLTRALFLANSSRLIVAGDLLGGMSPAKMEQKLKQGDAVIQLPHGVEYSMHDNAPLTDVQLKLIDYYQGRLMQQVTGIYDDFRGKETNASSAVAQKQRQVNSARNNVYSFDNFSYMKEREARYMMNIIQSSGEENILAQIFTPEERSSIVLNLSREVNGKKVIFNDIRNLPLSFYVEEVPDFGSSSAENRDALENLLANPIGIQLGQSPTLLKMLQVRDYEKVAKEFQQIAAMQQSGQPGAQSQDSSPPGLMEAPPDLQQAVGAA